MYGGLGVALLDDDEEELDVMNTKQVMSLKKDFNEYNMQARPLILQQRQMQMQQLQKQRQSDDSVHNQDTSEADEVTV